MVPFCRIKISFCNKWSECQEKHVTGLPAQDGDKRPTGYRGRGGINYFAVSQFGWLVDFDEPKFAGLRSTGANHNSVWGNAVVVIKGEDRCPFFEKCSVNWVLIDWVLTDEDTAVLDADVVARQSDQATSEGLLVYVINNDIASLHR